MSTHMNTIFIKTKAFVALLLCLLTFALAGARPACAGQWKIVCQPVNGVAETVSGKGPEYPEPKTYTKRWTPENASSEANSGIGTYARYEDLFPIYHGGGTSYRFGLSSARVKATINVVFTWVPNPYLDPATQPDPPPPLLFFKETSNAVVEHKASAERGQDIIPAPWQEEVFADNGLGFDARTPSGFISNEIPGLSTGSMGSRCVLVKTGGKATVKLSRTFKVGASLKEHLTSDGGWLHSWVSYHAQIGDFGFYPSVDFFNVVKLKPHDIEFDAYVKPAMRPEFLNGPDSKFQDFDFWEGPGYYSVHAMVGGGDAFDPQKYEWGASGADLTPPNVDGATNNTASDTVEGSTPQKTFNFDFGDIDENSLDKFSKPITTTVNVTVSGPGEDADSTSETLTARAKVNWHLPPGTLFEGTINLENLRPPDDGVPADIDDKIAELEEVRKVFAQAPGTMVKLAWENGKIVVKFMMPDKLDLVLGVGGKVFKAVKIIKAFERFNAAGAAAGLKRLQKWSEKRRLAGKPDNAAINAFVETLRKKSVGSVPSGATRDLDEAGESLKKGASRLGNCFVAGTPVVMADGSTKPIEDVKVGDEVMSRDENDRDGEVKAKKVVQLFKHLATKTLALRFAGGEHIETTSGHPFYVEGQGFVQAGELGIGNSIVTRAGPSVAIESIERNDESASVYNFEVEEFHTYFVGKVNDGLWVHNDSLTDRIATGHAWDKHVKTGEFQDLGIVDAWGHQEKFSA